MAANPIEASKGLGDEGASTSVRLLLRARQGDRGALEHLYERLAPGLMRWARGRLPRWARGMADTADVVQDTLVNALRGLEGFEPRRRKALQAYLRQAVRNRIRDEIRRSERRPRSVPLEDAGVASPVSPVSPLEFVMEAENVERYRRALARLDESDRELVVARLELGYTYEQVALIARKASPDAARRSRLARADASRERWIPKWEQGTG
jgi:RNA polymerase sigma factor (sigma-70 family)